MKTQSNTYRKIWVDNLPEGNAQSLFQKEGKNRKKNMKTENQIETIYASYINGNFTQTRDQIADALENQLPVLDLVEEITSEAGGHGRFRLFVAKAVAKYIATASDDAKAAVLDW